MLNHRCVAFINRKLLAECRDLESGITRPIKYLLLFNRLFAKWTGLTVISNYKKRLLQPSGSGNGMFPVDFQ